MNEMQFQVWPKKSTCLVIRYQCCKMNLQRQLFVFYLIHLQFLLSKRLNISATENFCFHIKKTKLLEFWLNAFAQCKIVEKGFFLGKTGKNWLMIIQNEGGKIRTIDNFFREFSVKVPIQLVHNMLYRVFVH